MKENSNRIEWITLVKALCMLFVYLSHSGIWYGMDVEWLRPYYGPFFVNAFFVASGYLLFRKQIGLLGNREASISGGG